VLHIVQELTQSCSRTVLQSSDSFLAVVAAFNTSTNRITGALVLLNHQRLPFHIPTRTAYATTASSVSTAAVTGLLSHAKIDSTSLWYAKSIISRDSSLKKLSILSTKDCIQVRNTHTHTCVYMQQQSANAKDTSAIMHWSSKHTGNRCRCGNIPLLLLDKLESLMDDISSSCKMHTSKCHLLLVRCKQPTNQPTNRLANIQQTC
jgi:hypothetical protein